MPARESCPEAVELRFLRTGETISIQKPLIHIGRERGCDILLTDLAIARHHALLMFQDGNWYLQATNASNGIWLNRRKLAPTEKCLLHPNDVIGFPRATGDLLFSPVAEASHSPGPHDDLHNAIGQRFQIVKQLNSDSFSALYQAVDKTTDQMRTVRTCLKSDATKQLRLSLLGEAAWLEQQDHPALPKIHLVTEDAHALYIVQEQLQGETLDTLLSLRGKASVSEAADWAIQVCDFLRYLHQSDPLQIHTDIRPANLLLQHDGRIRVIRYHPSIYLQNLPLQLPTQPGYAAPEQFPGGTADARTDIYGLGMTMYHLLSGHDPNDPPYGIPSGPWCSPDAPRSFKTIVLRCTERDPGKRYQTADELFHALKRARLEYLVTGLFRLK